MNLKGNGRVNGGNPRNRSAGWTGTLAVGLAVGLALTAGACDSPYSHRGEFIEPPTPHATVTEFPVRLIAALPGAEGTFAPGERHRLASFIDAYREGGRGPLTVAITAPSGAAANSAAAALRLLAQRRGVSEEALVVTTSGQGRPGLMLRYSDFAAVPPECNPEVVLNRSPNMAVSPNLGCAVERNFTAMVAHPADLIAPTPEADGDGAHATRVVGAYRHGKSTQSEVNRNDDAKASKAGSN